MGSSKGQSAALRKQPGCPFRMGLCKRNTSQRRAKESSKNKLHIFASLSGPYFRPHQSRSFSYAPSSDENLTSKIQDKSEAAYSFQIPKAVPEKGQAGSSSASVLKGTDFSARFARSK